MLCFRTHEACMNSKLFDKLSQGNLLFYFTNIFFYAEGFVYQSGHIKLILI